MVSLHILRLNLEPCGWRVAGVFKAPDMDIVVLRHRDGRRLPLILPGGLAMFPEHEVWSLRRKLCREEGEE